jgi:hypothetical protein
MKRESIVKLEIVLYKFLLKIEKLTITVFFALLKE